MSFIKIAATGLVAFGAMVFTAPLVAHADPASVVKAADTDNDGTIDLAEAKKAAMAHFKAADTDHEGTLDSKEAGMDVKAIDTDSDGTVDAAEYEKAVTAAFKAADPDNDGTIDAKELATPAGQKLAALLGAKS